MKAAEYNWLVGKAGTKWSETKLLQTPADDEEE